MPRKSDKLTSTIKIQVPGKIILSGEHAVVYGQPALVMAVDRRLRLSAKFNPDRIDLDFFKQLLGKFSEHNVAEIIKFLSAPESGVKLTMQSEIPIGCGMGSSAALAVAVAALVLRLSGGPTDRETINQNAYLLEKHIHQNPSGVDNTIVVSGGMLLYQKVSETEKKLSPIAPQNQLPQLWAINTGTPEESTGEMVALVRERLAKKPEETRQTLAEIGKITTSWHRFLCGQNNNFSLFEAIRQNERFLESLGVVSARAQAVIRSIESIGGAAKISGAGGKTGASGIVIAYHQGEDQLLSWLKNQKLDWFPVKLSPTGIEVSDES